MAKISKDIEQRIKDELSVLDALEEVGASPRRSGAGWECTSPFREDRHSGSFRIKERENFAKDFATGETYDAIKVLMEGLNLSYPEALRYGAKMLKIDLPDSDEIEVKREVKPVEKRPELKLQLWTIKVAEPYRGHDELNPLLQYMDKMPLNDTDKRRLKYSQNAYYIGTYPNQKYYGWTIWWYMDDLGYVRTGKMMLYKADGHRNKDVKPSFMWVHSLMQRWLIRQDGIEYESPKWNWDNHTHRVDICLFGQHLMSFYPKAVIRIVESEKTAVLCSAFTDPDKVIWMASGGKSMLTDHKLLYLLKKDRRVELFPDHDGIAEWRTKIERSPILGEYIKNGRLTVSPTVEQYWREEDGEKADIADIMIRIVTTPTTRPADKVAISMGAPEQADVLDNLINTLNLKQI